MAKEIKYGVDARKALESGVNTVSRYSQGNTRTERKKRSS